MKEIMMAGVALCALSSMAHAQGYDSCSIMKAGGLPCVPNKALENQVDRYTAQQAEKQRQAAEQERASRTTPKSFNVPAVHLSCDGSFANLFGKRHIELDIIPQEAKAQITDTNGNTSDLPLYNVQTSLRRIVNQYGNEEVQKFMITAKFGTDGLYVDDGWPRIRYYEMNKGGQGQYSCVYN